MRLPSSTYLKARDPAALAPVTDTLTVRFWAVRAPRRGVTIRKSGAGGGGAGAALVVVALTAATPVVFAPDADAV
jgi:carbon monoxide dehydrogenase subunit G